MKEAPSFRPATPADAAVLAGIHRLARAEAMPWLAVVHTPEEDFEFFLNQVLPDSDVHVACCGEMIAGFIARQDNHIGHLYVSPAFWNRAIGSLLLARMQREADSLDLWTFQRNAGARRFYERHNFTAMEFTDGSRNEEKEPDVRYVWHAPA
jgi:ribosomal protein S18 acetylase RimI-like enzyme